MLLGNAIISGPKPALPAPNVSWLSSSFFYLQDSRHPISSKPVPLITIGNDSLGLTYGTRSASSTLLEFIAC